MIRQRLRANLYIIGFDWPLANLLDVHVTYTAESGLGCRLSVVAITFSVMFSAYQCECAYSTIVCCQCACCGHVHVNSQGQCFLTVVDRESAWAMHEAACTWEGDSGEAFSVLIMQ